MKRKNRIKSLKHFFSELDVTQITTAIFYFFIITGIIIGGIIGRNIIIQEDFTNNEISECTQIVKCIHENGVKSVSDKIIKRNYDIDIKTELEQMIILVKYKGKGTIRFYFDDNKSFKYSVIKSRIIDKVLIIASYGFLGFMIAMIVWFFLSIIFLVLCYTVKLIQKAIKARLRLKHIQKSKKDKHK